MSEKDQHKSDMQLEGETVAGGGLGEPNTIPKLVVDSNVATITEPMERGKNIPIGAGLARVN